MPILFDTADANGLIKVCAEKLLKDPDKIHDRLNVVDKHMQSYDQEHQTVLLPAGHEFLEPLVKVYINDLGGFTNFILTLRDSFDRKSRQFENLQALYRRINGRHVQQARRERMGRAIAKAEELYGEVQYTHRLQWAADLEHQWAKRRLEFLERERKRIGTTHLATEDRAEALLEFWDIIDTEIHEGSLPKWN